MKTKKPSVARLKKKADIAFSLYIRKRDKNICFTCGRQGNQAGHFRSRRYNSTRYDPLNVHCQCMQCNVLEHGNQYIYGINLDKKYGSGTAEKLYNKSLEHHKLTIEELTDIMVQYK